MASNLDLDQFHAAFLEESTEALDSMESALLSLDAGRPDPETINTVFRVAHSVKGGAGMFGFSDIATFTHVLETLLDALRAGSLPVTQPMSDCLLRSVDVMRGMLDALGGGPPADPAAATVVREQLEAFIGAEPAVAAPAARDEPENTAAPVAAGLPRWHIRFEPRPTLLVRGNDPSRMFSELEVLGNLEICVDPRRLRCLADVDPENCELAWDLYLETAAPVQAIELIFEWAEGDCILQIEPAPSEVIAAAPEAAASAVTSGEPAAVIAQPSPVHDSRPAAEGARAAGTSTSTSTSTGAGDGGSIRVSIEKIDELLNTVGEIVITQSMLSQLAKRLEGLDGELLCNGLAQLETNIRELQESVMRVRMLPVSFVFSRFPRLVRDLSQRLGKDIRLTMTGEHTELDKTVLEKIGDPLVHLLRNSIDHGIELPDERVAQGKPAAGTVHLHAAHKGGAITLEIGDDGKGLDKVRLLEKARSRGLVEPSEQLTDAQIHELIFLPGFSTADKTTDLSGRGVGMDVVRRNIKELGGTIDLQSEPGVGTRFTITLPLTLAIVDGQSVAVGSETYIVPLVTIIESLQLKAGAGSNLVGHAEVFCFRGEYVPVIRLHEVFGVKPATTQLHEGLLMVVEGEGRRVGLFVDALLGQQQVVIMSMETNYGQVPGVGGATILGDGTVALILDIPGLIRVAARRAAARRAA